MGAFPGGQVTTLALLSHSPRQTQALGALLGRLARAGDIFLLIGPLGVGKTCLVQGLARGLEVRDYVGSPTFTIIREYQGRLPLYHIDFFRVEGPRETLELGLEDYFAAGGVCVVEWADKALEALPRQHLAIEMEFRDDLERALRLEGRGQRYGDLVETVRRRHGRREGALA